MRTGTKSHPIHHKPAIARKFYPGGRCWRLYFKIQRILIELGF